MKKKFDCVEMKQQAAMEINKHLSGLSFDEKVLYWQKRNEIFQQEQKQLYNLNSSHLSEINLAISGKQ